MRERPRLALGGFVAALLGAIALGGEASSISKLAIGLAGAIVAVLLPLALLRRSPVPDETGVAT
jgi:hypothetical protein